MNLRSIVGMTITRDLFDADGTLAGWQNVANMCFAPECEAQAVLILASFAAPLMSLLKTDEGGALVSIYGGKKSGKDLALLAAETVWGPPGFLVDNPLDLENLPVIMPTLYNRDPRSAHKMVSGLLLKGENTVWRTLFLTRCPLPLFEAAWPDGMRKPGVEYAVRVPGLLIDAKGDKRLRAELIGNHGNAGFEYLHYLVNPGVIGWCKRELVACIGRIADAQGDISERRFEARAIAAITVAAHVVRSCGVIDVDPERIERWMVERTFPVKQGVAA